MRFSIIMNVKIILFVVLLIFAVKYYSTLFNSEYTDIVNIRQGYLKGLIQKSSEGNTFYSFVGIPYAKPPVKQRRFQPPEPAEKWDGIKVADTAGQYCTQYDTFVTRQILGDENCLYLNVYSRKIASTLPSEGEKLLPVFVFIHGGAFREGFSDPILYGPEIMMNKQVVLVTFNYRVGALGFLSTGTKLLPGNLGLKDTVMVLKWIEENIEHFSGDPNCVTIFGQSAGGVMVHYLMMSPLTKGLFHRAISMSGTAMNSWAYMTKQSAETKIKSVSETVGCSTDINENMINCLMDADAVELTKAGSSIKVLEGMEPDILSYICLTLFGFYPTIETSDILRYYYSFAKGITTAYLEVLR